MTPVRRRYVVLLVPLAALPVALALLIGREPGPRRHVEASPGSAVSLNLKDGVANTVLRACGDVHHYTRYAAGTTITFDGAVVNAPAGRWRVKAKLKACIAGRFEGAGEVPLHRGHGGRFKGGFHAPVPGFYFLRAQLNAGGGRLARSAKEFFEVR